MFLGIEIGGTKLQFGVSTGNSLELADFTRLDVRPSLGAAGIREQILNTGRELIRQHRVQRVGIGFGGPVDSRSGRTIKSHQITGWDNFELVRWCEQSLNVPTILGNDCDVATLAEARYGAGLSRSSVFYVTVGTGVGGGCVIDGKVLGQGRAAIAEIGHLRPGLDATDAGDTVESMASGWAIAASARSEIANAEMQSHNDARELLSLCDGDSQQLTSLIIAQAAAGGNGIALRAIDRACRALGWALGQVVTLLAPEVLVLGGGVSLMGEELFFRPIRAYVERYAFLPNVGTFDIVPAKLGERVVVYGAIALAAGGDRDES